MTKSKDLQGPKPPSVSLQDSLCSLITLIMLVKSNTAFGSLKLHSLRYLKQYIIRSIQPIAKLSQTSDQFRWAKLYGFNAYGYVISHDNLCRFHLLV